MVTVILDTDFLSSFLKIERLGLVKAFFFPPKQKPTPSHYVSRLEPAFSITSILPIRCSSPITPAAGRAGSPIAMAACRT